ncbi:MAG: DNA polymerase III subunit gamma/tau [Planctomycetaceae bacterium]|jgi:DNA polymerase-3 subunit gamma/tau|nr:DNA polymerase III subunit gamma/tau [Planctomycetaceae bacterium]
MATQKTKREKFVNTVGLNIGLDDDDVADKPKSQTPDEPQNKTVENKTVENPKSQTVDESKNSTVGDPVDGDHVDEVDESVKSDSGNLDDHSLGSESYQVVARRYRPKTFEELVGQSHISQALANAITTGRIGHAYLFTGARGVGKTSTARIFSKSLNCVTGPTPKPCGECDSCVGISTGEDIDVLEIDGASNRGIDEIRQLRLSASICPSRSKFKIYIIDEVHMLTREAFNALLKILEEPPEHVKFIFCTTEPSKIPITILSRCQRYDFAGIDGVHISHHLSEIAANEGVTAEEGVFDLLARRAAGSMRDAQSLLEQLLSFAPQRIMLSDVHNMLGTANDQLLFRLLESILNCETVNIFADLDAAISEGVDLVVLVEQLMGLLRDLLVVVSGGNASLMIFCTPSQFERAVEFAQLFGIQRILAAIQILDQTYNRMRYNTQTRILVELALVRIAYLDNFQMVSVLLEKLRKGEIQFNAASDKPAVLPNETMKTARRIVQPVTSATAQPSPPQQPQPAQHTITTNTIATIKPNDKPKPLETQVNRGNSVVSGVVPVREWSIELSEIDEVKATEIWRSAVDSVAGILGSSASVFLRVQFEKPDTFIVVFQNLSTKEYCERELPRLRGALCQTVGKTIQLRLVYEETKQTTKPNQPQVRTSQESRAIFESAANNSLVKKISELFRTELIDTK